MVENVMRFRCKFDPLFSSERILTRSQAVARIADRVASQ